MVKSDQECACGICVSFPNDQHPQGMSAKVPLTPSRADYMRINPGPLANLSPTELAELVYIIYNLQETMVFAAKLWVSCVFSSSHRRQGLQVIQM